MRTITEVERFFPDDELIVTKTDVAGRITYANHVFTRISGFSLEELVGKPHNIVRHPLMPRGIFKHMWAELLQGREIFAYVINLTKRGDFYWVFAHITPSFDAQRQIIGFHSNRRTPNRAALGQVTALYAQLIAEEAKFSDRRAAAEASKQLLERTLAARGVSYEQFAFELETQRVAA
jgi:PAS domain S-box-containing protein